MKFFFLLLLILAFAGTAACAQDPNAQAGLWVGTVSITQVSEPSGALAPTASPFEFRILFHVNTQGQVRLLQDVIVMQRDDDNDPITAPKIVLVTDPAKIPLFTGVIRKEGRLAGLRYGASAYHFTGAEKQASGALAPDKALTYELDCAENDPVNPLRHKFHPDNAQGMAVTRKVVVNFAGSSVTDAPGYGVKRITGTYKERIEKLTNHGIDMAGSITLDRISTVGVLNQ